jgi:inorganic pyrophosphatase
MGTMTDRINQSSGIPNRVSKEQVQGILRLLDRGETDSVIIAENLGLTRQQVAAVKAWRTMGIYESKKIYNN